MHGLNKIWNIKKKKSQTNRESHLISDTHTSPDFKNETLLVLKWTETENVI